jgi:TBC1 domain family member 8/9
MSNAFEYGDALLPEPEDHDEDSPPPQIDSNQPYLNLATFRMVVLADEVLESFFETDLTESFRLGPVPLMDLPSNLHGFLGGLWSNIASDDNKKLFHKFSDELGKTIGKHHVIHRPSIGRYSSVEEPKTRESLLTPTMRRSSSKSSLAPTESSTTLSSASQSTQLSVDAEKANAKSPDMSQVEFSPMPLVHAANAALMERTPFAIDDAKDDDDDDDDDDDTEGDDGVLDGVCSFRIHVAATILTAEYRWTPSWRPTIPAYQMQISS